jgi:hypothetical protein
LSSEQDLELNDLHGKTQVTDANIVTLPPNHCHNLNSLGTHAVSAQVVAQLYSSHFSSRENVAAKSQEVATLYEQHFPDNEANAAADNDADSIDTNPDADNAAAVSDATSVDTTYDDDEQDAYDDDEQDAITLQREAASASLPQHHYTQHRRGRPGWHAPRPPTAHPDAAAPSSHRLQDWNVRVSTFTDQSGYMIENEDIMYCLPSAPGNTLR